MVCVGLGVGGAWGCSVFHFLCVPNLWYWIKISSVILTYTHGEGCVAQTPRMLSAQRRASSGKVAGLEEGGFAEMSGDCRETRHMAGGAPDSGGWFPYATTTRKRGCSPVGEPPTMVHTQGEQMPRTEWRPRKTVISVCSLLHDQHMTCSY